MNYYKNNMTVLIIFKKILVYIPFAFFALSCSSERSSEHRQDLEKETGQAFSQDIHTSKNSLDWQGVYQGVLPCADCDGIETRIVLKRDGTFEKSIKYLGKDDNVLTDTGSFVWDETGNKITLKGVGEDQQYHAGDNHLYHLDQEGRRITGDLADLYKLDKKKVDP